MGDSECIVPRTGKNSRNLTSLPTGLAWIMHEALDFDDHYGMGHGGTLLKALGMAAVQLYDRSERHPHILQSWHRKKILLRRWRFLLEGFQVSLELFVLWS